MAKQGSVIKMRITAYDNCTFSGKGETYDAMINPDKISLNRQIKYNEEQASNTTEASQKYLYTPPGDLSFDLVLDCTGIVDAERMDLSEELSALRSLLYDYQGAIHRPNFLIIHWGIGETFKCVLTSFNTTYTLFDSDGIPLRAKVALSFSSYLDPKSMVLNEAKNSPDLTHRVSVVAGDSLPILTQRVYGMPDYYMQLAEFNGLNKFRYIRPGSQLVFPPLVPDTADVDMPS